MTMLTWLFTGACLLACGTFAWSLLSSLFEALLLMFNIGCSLVAFCLWIPLFMLSLLPGVSGLLEFLLKTACYTVFRAHAQFVWDNLVACAALAVAVRFVSRSYMQINRLAPVAYLSVYCGTFVYITITNLLPMLLLAFAVALVAMAICHVFPPARPKYTGPLLCFVVSLIVHVHFDESHEVRSYF